jgi:hypothetical protein
MCPVPTHCLGATNICAAMGRPRPNTYQVALSFAGSSTDRDKRASLRAACVARPCIVLPRTATIVTVDPVDEGDAVGAATIVAAATPNYNYNIPLREPVPLAEVEAFLNTCTLPSWPNWWE